MNRLGGGRRPPISVSMNPVPPTDARIEPFIGTVLSTVPAGGVAGGRDNTRQHRNLRIVRNY
jgi:hypothetical protein